MLQRGSPTVAERKESARKWPGAIPSDVHATLYRGPQLEALKSSTSLGHESIPKHRLFDHRRVEEQEQSSEMATAISGPKSHAMALGHSL
jgi:hypothetical protein